MWIDREIRRHAGVHEKDSRFESWTQHWGKKSLVRGLQKYSGLQKVYKITKRTAWRAISSIEQKEESKGSKNLKSLKEYKKLIEKELNKFCDEILNLIENQILSTCSNSESKVFFLKMQGDYHRYISEYAVDSQYDNASLKADTAYKKATEIAETDLKTTNPIRLGLALNFSVFCYEALLFYSGSEWPLKGVQPCQIGLRWCHRRYWTHWWRYVQRRHHHHATNQR